MNDVPDYYLAGLPSNERSNVARVNRAGITALRDYLTSGEAIAFLGSPASAPLYPPMEGIIDGLLASAFGRFDEHETEALIALSKESPEEAAEILRRQLGGATYLAALRSALRVRADSHAGHTWTPVQELVCRCNFRGVVTTAYDPGIIDARARIRQRASGTGFTTWQDELSLDEWRTRDVFRYIELPVLYAHGHQGQPDSALVSATDYQRAYAGKLADTLRQLVENEHIILIGFSFANRQIAAIIREAASRSGTRLAPGAAPRHVAILPWDPTIPDNSPGLLARRSEISYGAAAVFYPSINGESSALVTLLSALTDSRYPAFSDGPVGSTVDPIDGRGHPSTPPPLWDQPAGKSSVRDLSLPGGEGEARTRIDRTAGVQIGSGNIQVNYFYGNPAGAPSDSSPAASPLPETTDPPYRGHAFISYAREDSDEVDMAPDLDPGHPSDKHP
jgi:SIR2-like domain